MNRDLDLLRATKPSAVGEGPPPELFDEIVSGYEHPTGRDRPKIRFGRPTQIVAVIAAVLTVGVGATWAATGELPPRLLFGHELDEGLTVGKDDTTSRDFSVLQPAGEDVISELPNPVLEALQSIRVIPPSPGGGPIGENAKPTIELQPGTITAVGEARTEPSGAVSIVAINGQVCSIWIETGLSNCGKPTDIDQRGLISAGHFGPGGGRQALGLVNDRVAAIRIEGTQLPDVPVSGNVFEVTGLPEGPIALVGIDSQGIEVTRRGLP